MFDGTKATNPTVSRDGAEVLIRWDSAEPASTEFQVYILGRLAWHGRGRFCRVPAPLGTVPVEVGAVGPGEGLTDFSADLPPAPARSAELTWYGGTFLSPSLAAFRVYSSSVPSGPVDRSAPVASLRADDQEDGAGFGPAGEGGAGQSAGTYRWVSGRLAPGLWQFEVVSVDASGNAGVPPLSFSVAVAGPPGPPLPDASGARLRGSYVASSRRLTLRWTLPA